jgi:hypothetical protein
MLLWVKTQGNEVNESEILIMLGFFYYIFNWLLNVKRLSMNSRGLKIKQLKLALGLAIFIVPTLTMAIQQNSIGLTTYGFRAPVGATSTYAPVASHSSAPLAAPSSVRAFAPVTARSSTPAAAQSSAAVARPVAAQSSVAVARPVAAQSSAAVARPVAAQSSVPVARPVAAQSSAAVARPVAAQSSVAVARPVAAQSSAAVARPVAAQSSVPVARPVAAQSSVAVARPVAAQSSAPVAAPTSTNAFAPVFAHAPVSVPNISSSIPLTFNGAGNLQNMMSVQNAAPIALSTGVSILGTNSATGSAVGANATVAALTNNAGNGISNIQQTSGTNNDQTGLAANTAAKSNIQNSASSASGGQLNINAGDGLNSNAVGSLTSTSIVTASQLSAGFKAPVVPATMVALPYNTSSIK